jgi:hypothetical protein
MGGLKHFAQLRDKDGSGQGLSVISDGYGAAPPMGTMEKINGSVNRINDPDITFFRRAGGLGLLAKDNMVWKGVADDGCRHLLCLDIEFVLDINAEDGVSICAAVEVFQNMFPGSSRRERGNSLKLG